MLLAWKMKDQLEKMAPTERRKAVNQAARNSLPNETETAIVLTGNVRAWRHVLEMRGALSADVPISRVTLCAYEILKTVSPVLFGDYDKRPSATDADRDYLTTPHRKV